MAVVAVAEVASAFVSILPSTKGFGRSLDSQLGRDLDSSGKKAGSRFGGALKAGLIGGAAGVGVAAAKILSSSVSAASDAQQSLGATRTVFGKFASGVIKDSNKAAAAIGLSANEYRELSNVSGALLAGAGTPLKKLGGLTSDLNKRAADMAATFGGTTREAVEAISSLLKGEADPIERYGVSIKQSDVNARLAAKGLDTLTGSALKQAEQQERLGLLMDKTSKTAGAFSRESDTLANRQQILGAKFTNLKASIGTALLPTLTKLATFIINKVMPSIEGFGKTLNGGSPIINKVAGFVRDDLVPALKDFGAAVLPKVKDALASVKKGLNDAQPFFTFLGDVVTNVLLPVMSKLARTVLPLVANQIEALGKGFGLLGRLGTALWNKALQPALKFILNGVGSILDLWSTMLSALGNVPGFGWAKKAAEDMSNAADEVRGLADGLKKIKSKTVTVTTVFMTRNAGKEKRMGDDFLGRMALPNQQQRGSLMDIYGRGAMDALSRGLEKGGKKTREQLTKMLDGLTARLSGFKDAFASIAESVTSAFTGDLFNVSAVTDEAGNVVKSVSQAFIDNLLAKKGELTTVLASFKTLAGWGINPKFLSQLLASGGASLINEIAGMGQAGASSTAALFGEVTNLSSQLGNAVAANDIGPNIDAVKDEIKELRADLKKGQKETVKAMANLRLEVTGVDAGRRAYLRTGQ